MTIENISNSVSSFIHLRVHSFYSLSEGAISIGEVVSQARSQKMPAVSIADTCNLFGALEFSKTSARNGVQPIVGALVNVSSLLDGDAQDQYVIGQSCQIMLLCQTQAGYQNLMKLVSSSHLRSEVEGETAVSVELLRKHSEKLICLAGGDKGPLGRKLLELSKPEQRLRLARQLKDIFEDRLYIEIQRCGEDYEREVEAVQLELAYALGIPLVATNDVYFRTQNEHEAHDALLCIAEKVFIDTVDRRKVTKEHYFKSADQMIALFSDIPEAIQNTMVIAQRCSTMVAVCPPLLPRFSDSEGASEKEMLQLLANEGLETRFQTVVVPSAGDQDIEALREKYWKRLSYELDVIFGMNFPGYFLIVSDFMKWAKENGIPVGVRGSGATSIVAWSLFITHLDPIRFDLVFERFLNPERVSMPDFDIDFCQDRRGEVIRYVQEKYGFDRVAQIITFGKLQAKAAIRDIGRVLQMPYGLVDRISKMIPEGAKLGEAFTVEPRLREIEKSESLAPKLFSLARILEGAYRHASTHAAGLVIGGKPLEELVALYKDPGSEIPLTQFHFKDVEQIGLVKFDFLGLKTLTVLAKTEALIYQSAGIHVNVSEQSFDDPQTYELLSNGDSTGVFQLESAGMRDLLKKLKPDRFEDIIALISLYRPGPMDSIPTYISRKLGVEPVEYLHPILEPILEETYGVITYQEDVMQIARVMAGYSLGEADLLRRAMGKKIKAEMDEHQTRFIEGAMERGVPTEIASAIFEQCAKFASYGFNKGHAASYAQIAFQTAWLRTHYPIEFNVACMTLDASSPERIELYFGDLKNMGRKLLLPDINQSEVDFSIGVDAKNEKCVKYGFSAVKGVGIAVLGRICDERRENGKYEGLIDFFNRCPVEALNKKVLERLAMAGAFDCLEENRNLTIHNLERLIAFGQSQHRMRNSDQCMLFGPEEELESSLFVFDQAPPWPENVKLENELIALGFYLSGHPLGGVEKLLDEQGVKNYKAALESGKTKVKIAGVVRHLQRRTAKSGNSFAFLGLSDVSGPYEVVLFSEQLSQSAHILNVGEMVVIEGVAARDAGGFKLNVVSVHSLDKMFANQSLALTINVDDDHNPKDLKALLDGFDVGKTMLRLIIPIQNDEFAHVRLPTKFSIGTGQLVKIENVKGVASVSFS